MSTIRAEYHYCDSKSSVQKTSHLAVLEFSSITIPGDARSRSAPGHGYPEHSVTNIQYIVFDNEQAWKDYIAKNHESNMVALRVAGQPEIKPRVCFMFYAISAEQKARGFNQLWTMETKKSVGTRPSMRGIKGQMDAREQELRGFVVKCKIHTNRCIRSAIFKRRWYFLPVMFLSGLFILIEFAEAKQLHYFRAILYGFMAIGYAWLMEKSKQSEIAQCRKEKMEWARLKMSFEKHLERHIQERGF